MLVAAIVACIAIALAFDFDLSPRHGAAPSPPSPTPLVRSTADSSFLLRGDGASAAAASPSERPAVANPVIGDDVADPFVTYADGGYWAFSTNHPDANVPVRRSDDLQHWSEPVDALPDLPAWATPRTLFFQATWAPAVMAVGARWALYYTAGVRSAGRECISVAIADHIEGPYVDSSTAPLVCQLPMGGSIDPDPMVDADGHRFLVWKNDGNCCHLPTRIWSQPLSDDGQHLLDQPVELLRDTLPWEADNIEAPQLVRVGSSYVLFYSANRWDTGAYAVGYAICQGPLGPCERPDSHPLLTSGHGMEGPGGNSAFVDEHGNWWLAVHAWPSGHVLGPAGRALWLLPLAFPDGRPIVSSAGA